MFGFLRFWTSCTVTSCTVRRGMMSSSSVCLRYKKTKTKPESLLGFQEQSNPNEKVCTSSVLCHSRCRDLYVRMQQTQISPNRATSDFLSSIQPLESHKLTVGCFLVSLSFLPHLPPVPLTAPPAKLPAYPSPPTPIRVSGTRLKAPWTNLPAASQRARARS